MGLSVFVAMLGVGCIHLGTHIAVHLYHRETGWVVTVFWLALALLGMFLIIMPLGLYSAWRFNQEHEERTNASLQKRNDRGRES
ncbi:MAG TPA: hypothetical protein DD670_03640 [Planctomycetaceae bacterium]|nr:hypothetical protein [Planctomycetaceae bacterium]